MAYENVDVQSAKNAINEIKSSINYSNTNEIISELSNNGIWNANAKNNLKNALTKLVDENYKDLQNSLDNYLSILDNIYLYKQKQAEYNNIQNQLNGKKNTLTSVTNKDNQYKKNNQSYTQSAINNRNVKKNTETDISNLNQELINLSNEMNSLKNIIDSSI